MIYLRKNSYVAQKRTVVWRADFLLVWFYVSVLLFLTQAEKFLQKKTNERNAKIRKSLIGNDCSAATASVIQNTLCPLPWKQSQQNIDYSQTSLP